MLRQRLSNYELPDELIAAGTRGAPQAEAGCAPRGRDGALADLPFVICRDCCGPANLLVFNDTRVIRRAFTSEGRVAGSSCCSSGVTGGTSCPRAVALEQAAAAGSTDPPARRRGRDRGGGATGDLWLVDFGSEPRGDLRAARPRCPLPPYLRRAPEAFDASATNRVRARAGCGGGADSGAALRRCRCSRPANVVGANARAG